VQTKEGTTKTVGDIQLGDEIMVAYQNGTVGFEKVIIITGAPDVIQQYVTLLLSDGGNFTLSPDHYVHAGPTCCDKRSMSLPQSLVRGQTLWVGNNGSSSQHVQRTRIVDITYSTDSGAYNMFTASDGQFVNIMVDNVVASSFTENFELVGLVDADAAFDFMQPLFNLFALNENLTKALGNTSKDIINDVGVKMMQIPGRQGARSSLYVYICISIIYVYVDVLMKT
jgi:hypothetical protein